MTKQELANEFIKNLNENKYDNFYKFFTKESSFYIVNENKEIYYQECLDMLSLINFNLSIKRIFESKVCVKIETINNNEQINFFFDIKNRRIKRLEIEFIK